MTWVYTREDRLLQCAPYVELDRFRGALVEVCYARLDDGYFSEEFTEAFRKDIDLFASGEKETLPDISTFYDTIYTLMWELYPECYYNDPRADSAVSEIRRYFFSSNHWIEDENA